MSETTPTTGEKSPQTAKSNRVCIITYNNGQECRTCESTLATYNALYGKFKSPVKVTDEECECDRCKPDPYRCPVCGDW